MPTLSYEQKFKIFQDYISDYEWTIPADSALAWCDLWIAEAGKAGDVKEEEIARTRKLTIIYNNESWARLIEEATIQKEWMETNKQWDAFYKAWRDIIEGHSYLHHPQTALREAQKLQDHALEHDNLLGRALAYQQMGIIYDYIDHAESAKAFEQCVTLMETRSDSMIIANELLGAYYYLCQELDQLKQYDRELAVSDKWKKHLGKLKEKELTVSKLDVHYIEYHLWRASAHFGLKQFEQVHTELKAAETLNDAVNDRYLKYQTLVRRAQLALAEGNPKLALEYSNQYLPIMSLDNWEVAQHIRGEILMSNGFHKEAALLYRKMCEQKDSTFTKDVRIQLDEFNTLFQLDEVRMKAKFQLDELRMKGQLERSRFIMGIIILVVLALLLFIYFRYRASKRLQDAHNQLLIAHGKLEKTNERLTIANARAEESSKMKTNFIHQISHEIRTPLNILSGFTQIVTTPGMELDDATRKDINKKITENTDRITGLVNKMLELSDASSQSVIERSDTVPVIQIAALAVDNSGIAQVSHLAFDFRIPAEAETVNILTNSQQAVRALAILLDNAQKFTKEGQVVLSVAIADGQAIFTVEDTGIGIPKEEAEHIFEEFVQLDDYYDGTGIGLTVARSIARRLDGDITLDTSYTAGARFILTLPLT